MDSRLLSEFQVVDYLYTDLEGNFASTECFHLAREFLWNIPQECLITLVLPHVESK